MPDERSWSGSAHRQTADAHNDSQHVISARHAAEALFKPKTQTAPLEPSDTPASSDPLSQRRPRILTSSKMEPEPGPKVEAHAAAQSERQEVAKAEGPAKILASEYRRARTLRRME